MTSLSGLSSLNTSEVQFKPSAAFLTYQKQKVREQRVLGLCVVIDSEIDAIPETEHEVQTQPEQSQEDPEQSQEDPETITGGPIPNATVTTYFYILSPIIKKTANFGEESGALQWPQLYKVAVGEEAVHSEKLESLTVVSVERVDDREEVVKQLQPINPKATESPTKVPVRENILRRDEHYLTRLDYF